MRKSTIHNRFALASMAMMLPASIAIAGDFRTEFPSHMTSTPMGVNLQTGKFVYFPYSFEMGPFVLKRGFNQTGYNFVGIAVWRTVQTAGGAGQAVFSVYLGATSIPTPSDIGNSTKLDFVSNGSGGFIWWSNSALGYKLQRIGSGYQLTDRSGNLYYFSDIAGTGYGTPNGRSTLVTFADGTTVAVEYDASNRIKFMKNNRGYAVLYEYLTGGQQKICGFNLVNTYASASSTDANTSTSPLISPLPPLPNGFAFLRERERSFDIVLAFNESLVRRPLGVHGVGDETIFEAKRGLLLGAAD